MTLVVNRHTHYCLPFRSRLHGTGDEPLHEPYRDLSSASPRYTTRYNVNNISLVQSVLWPLDEVDPETFVLHIQDSDAVCTPVQSSSSTTPFAKPVVVVLIGDQGENNDSRLFSLWRPDTPDPGHPPSPPQPANLHNPDSCSNCDLTMPIVTISRAPADAISIFSIRKEPSADQSSIFLKLQRSNP
ncbi:hypothetical protein BDW69DRAFT_8437 [Aspergillus filifer]